MPQEISMDVPFIPCRKYPVIFLTFMPVFLIFYFNERGLQPSHASSISLTFFPYCYLEATFPHRLLSTHTWSPETSRPDGPREQGCPLAPVAKPRRAAQMPEGPWTGRVGVEDVEKVLCPPSSPHTSEGFQKGLQCAGETVIDGASLMSLNVAAHLSLPCTWSRCAVLCPQSAAPSHPCRPSLETR